MTMTGNVAAAIVAVALDQREQDLKANGGVMEVALARLADLRRVADHLKADTDRARSDLDVLYQRTGRMKTEFPRYPDEKDPKLAAMRETIASMEHEVARAEQNVHSLNGCWRNALDAYTRAEEWLRQKGTRNLIDMRPGKLDTGLELGFLQGEISKVQRQLSALMLAPPPDDEIQEAAERWLMAARSQDWLSARLTPEGECVITGERPTTTTLLAALPTERAMELIISALHGSLRGRTGEPIARADRERETAKVQERITQLLHMEETLVMRLLLMGKPAQHRPGVTGDILLGVGVANAVN